jgi:hypothetical protein
MADLTLEQEVEQLKGVHACKNLMGTYMYLEMAGQYTEMTNLFARKTDGVAIEISDLGIWDGIESIKRLFEAYRRHEGDRIGILTVHPATTEDVKVARDGRTGKGVWFAPGIETLVIDGKLKPIYSYFRYGLDFVKEDDEWKILHFHAYLLYRKPYSITFSMMDAMAFGDPVPSMAIPEDLKPDRPPTVQNEHGPHIVQTLIPRPPTPWPYADVDTYEGSYYIESANPMPWSI